jgi:hypothetical protein
LIGVVDRGLNLMQEGASPVRHAGFVPPHAVAQSLEFLPKRRDEIGYVVARVGDEDVHARPGLNLLRTPV